jgi:hypothetical protein
MPNPNASPTKQSRTIHINHRQNLTPAPKCSNKVNNNTKQESRYRKSLKLMFNLEELSHLFDKEDLSEEWSQTV